MFSYTIKVNKLKQPAGKIVAFATLVIDEVLEVHGFRVINGVKGLFVSPPQHLGKIKNSDTGELEDKYFDDVRFVGDNWQDVADEVKGAVITAYHGQVNSQDRSQAANAHVSVNTPAANKTTGGAQQQPAVDAGQSRKPLW